jgi:hypothetical protein
MLCQCRRPPGRNWLDPLHAKYPHLESQDGVHVKVRLDFSLPKTAAARPVGREAGISATPGRV